MKKLTTKLLVLSFVITGVFAPLSVSIQPQQETVPLNRVSVEVQKAYAAEGLVGTVQSTCNGWDDFFCHIGNAFLAYFELIWFKTTQIGAFLAGTLVDLLLYHSISSATYRTGVIEAGWEILRNLVNIALIFTLMITAFKMVLGSGGSDTKKSLIKTVVIALVINFSLFVCYAIIDASNLLAHTFYNRISVETASVEGNGGNIVITLLNDLGIESPSGAIVSKFNPQRIVTDTAEGGYNFFELWLIVFFSGAINILMIWIFLGIVLFFLARTIGLILTCILAPIAFVTFALPFKSAVNAKYVGFQHWMKGLVGLSFMAPIYLFFLFLVITFINNDALFNSIAIGSNSGNVLTNIISVMIPFALIGTLLYTSKKITASLAGDIGGTIAGTVTKLAAGTASVAAGAAAIAATGGAAAAGGLLRAAPKGSKRNKAGRWLQTKSFDISQVPGFNQTLGKSAAGRRAAKLINTSYADVDTGVRGAANKARSMASDIKTGRTPQSVQDWDKKVEESKKKLTDRQIENAERQAEEKGTSDILNVKGFTDQGSLKSEYIKGENINKKLDEYRKELATRDPEQKKAEKDALREQQQAVQLRIDNARSDIKEMRKNKASQDDIKEKQDAINKLKKDKGDLEERTLEGKIKQLEKVQQKNKDQARANVVKKKSKDEQIRVGKEMGKKKD